MNEKKQKLIKMSSSEFKPIIENENEPNLLVSINKSRPKRSNVKKPTSKTPYSNIEIETINEDLSLTNNTKLTGKPSADSIDTNETQKHPEPTNNSNNETSANDSEQNKKVSPTVNSNKSSLFAEQPKIK